MSPNVIGLDLSITATGVAYEHAPGDLTTECWKMASKLGDCLACFCCTNEYGHYQYLTETATRKARKAGADI